MSTLRLSQTNPKALATPNAIQRRLTEAVTFIEQIEEQRLQELRFIEERLIGRELVDLELQEIDEQIERICASAALP